MGPLALAAIGAGIGALRARQQEADRANQMKVEQVREMWSPWTGRHGKDIAQVDKLGMMAQGAMAGATFGQQFKDKAPATTSTNMADNPAGATQMQNVAAPYDPMMDTQPVRGNYNPYAFYS